MHANLRRHGGLVVVTFLLSGSVAHSQETVTSARELYASAAYEDALLAFQRLKSDTAHSDAETKTIRRYLAFCMIALNRQAETNAAIEELVEADPLYTADEPDISPRLRATYREVRKKHLSAAVRRYYGKAKAAYDQKEFEKAAELFRTTLALLDDRDLSPADPDLRTLTVGFLELSIAAAIPPKPVVEAPASPPLSPLPPPIQVSYPTVVYSSEDTMVTPPVAIRQDVPRFPTVSGPGSNRGLLEVVVDESGKVESVVMRGSVNPVYDGMLKRAAKSWRYKPALRDGQPVKFRKLIQITIAAGSGPTML